MAHYNMLPNMQAFFQQKQFNAQTHLNLIQEAATSLQLAKQSKSTLKKICDALGIASKMKKQEMAHQIPQTLYSKIQNDIQTKSADQIIQETSIFREFKLLADIIKKFCDGLGKTQAQHRLNLQQLQYQQILPHFYIQPSQFQMQRLPIYFDFPQQSQQSNPQQQLYQQPPQAQQQLPLCPCKVQLRRKDNYKEIKCINCDYKVHQQCLNVSNPSQFECPSCVFFKIDPLHEIVKRLSKIVMSGENYPQYSQSVLHFIMSVDDYALMQSNPSYFVEIRSLRLDHKYMHEITWPDVGELQLNQIKVQEFKPLNSNSSLKKRKDEKYSTRDVMQGQNTFWVKEGYIENEMKPQLKLSEGAVYVFQVFMIRKLTPLELIEKVKKKKEVYQNKENSIQQIQRQCRSQMENEIADGELSIDSVRVSLKCQFDMMMIETPARGKFCDHIQCFSLENTIKMTSQVNPRKWKCPICKLRTFDLIIDEYQLEIIRSFKEKGKMIKEIYFDKMGQTISAQDDIEAELDDSFDESQKPKNEEKKNEQVILLEEDQEKKNKEMEIEQKSPEDQIIKNIKTFQQQINNPASDLQRKLQLGPLGQLGTQLQQQSNPTDLFYHLQANPQLLFSLYNSQIQQIQQAQQIKQVQQLQVKKQKNKEKEELQKLEQITALQQMSSHSKVQLKETMQKNQESLKERRSKLFIKEIKIYNKHTGFYDSQEDSRGISEKNGDMKLVRVIKKQFSELIRKNFGTIDNPITQPQPPKQPQAIKGRNVYHLSQTQELATLLQKQKLFEQLVDQQQQQQSLIQQQQHMEDLSKYQKLLSGNINIDSNPSVNNQLNNSVPQSHENQCGQSNEKQNQEQAPQEGQCGVNAEAQNNNSQFAGSQQQEKAVARGNNDDPICIDD